MTHLLGVGAVCVFRSQGGELRTAVGIDFSTTGLAPGNKDLHAQVHADRRLSLPPKLLLRALDSRDELGVGVVEGVSIFHDGLREDPFGLLGAVRPRRIAQRTEHCHVADGVLDVQRLESSAPSLRTCSEGCSHPSLCKRGPRGSASQPSPMGTGGHSPCPRPIGNAR